MINFSYNLSEPLKKTLFSIEELRKQLLVIPLSPRNALKLRFESNIDRIYSTLKLSNKKIEKHTIVVLLTSGNTRDRYKIFEREIFGYKKILDEIYFEWLVTKKNINQKIVHTFYDSLFVGSKYSVNPQYNELFEYINNSSEHPILQAAICYIETLSMGLFKENTSEIASLSSLCYLYKYGYDFLGLVIPEEEWVNDLPAYRDITSTVRTTRNLTLWLEHYALSIEKQLTYALTRINARVDFDVPASFFVITERQKEILILLTNPSKTITNRKVQSLFSVSQITAARDLVKLTSLGLLFPHGKGRSVYYTRV